MLARLGFKTDLGDNERHNTGVGAVRAVKRMLKRAIDFYTRSAEYWLQRVAKFIVQPGTQEADMAPKAAQNFGDKGEGARIALAGKDSGDIGFTGRRPVSGVIQQGGKNTAGIVKEDKEVTSAPPVDPRGKDKTQPAITTQGDEVRPTEASDNADLAKASNSGSMHPQSLELNGAIQAFQDRIDTLPAVGFGNSTKGIEDDKNSEVEIRKIEKSEKSKKGSDWSKDGSDKFYSLTEDSESTSSGCNQSAVVGSTLSESERTSTAAESTVRQQRRQRRNTKIQTSLTGSPQDRAPWHLSGIT
ncbi:hypothetical protein NDU88_006488 [Pleurodeles waltl]|uniref:Uncharacterized protein n=1 Tax=Pleurodeles waltl TaxID=8319 RepID=A0AAV7PLJ8_PLEWA|nr:hypothetical protein NDU88_006488 [Pleurodeles waltl]